MTTDNLFSSRSGVQTDSASPLCNLKATRAPDDCVHWIVPSLSRVLRFFPITRTSLPRRNARYLWPHHLPDASLSDLVHPYHTREEEERHNDQMGQVSRPGGIVEPVRTAKFEAEQSCQCDKR